MPTSEARILANKANSLKSTGPKSPIGKSISARNSLKHGMTGRGVVLPEGQVAEVERRESALRSEMAPRSEMSEILVRQLATLSVRMEESARQQFAATSERVRHAAERFDEERVEAAERLLATIGDDPRRVLRRLKRTPEGVDALILAWRDLRARLTREPWPDWDCQLGRMAHLMGLYGDDLRGTRLEAYVYATFGDLSRLEPEDGAGLADLDRRKWAQARVVERLDEEIAGLEAHLETLDLEALDLDRAEAADRALFDSSKDAILARRYEAEARRGFFRALQEFRQVEAEVEAEEEVELPPPSAEVAPDSAPLASFREGALEGSSMSPGLSRRPSGAPRHPSRQAFRSPEGRVAGS